jgi:hypothetical protein
VSAAPDDDGAPVALEELRELADRRRLADAVHADDEDDGRALGEPERRVELREVLLEGLLEHALQVPRIGRAVAVDLLAQLVDDALGDVGAEVGGEQRRLEVVPRVSSIVGLTNMPRRARPSDQEFSAMLSAYGPGTRRADGNRPP